MDHHFIRQLIEQYGYYALFIGTLCEGETILLLGGMAAKAGHLALPLVMLIAFCGSLLGDQIVFFIGRIYGRRFLAKRPRLAPRVHKIHRMLERHHTWLLIGFRFLYGLRNIIPLVIATSGVKTSRFIMLNIIGAALWAVTVSFLGYFIGTAVEAFLGKFRVRALIAVAGLALVIWIGLHVYGRLKARKQPPPVPPDVFDKPPPTREGE
jgi:membrane protein DedA with SNARE-associated domain